MSTETISFSLAPRWNEILQISANHIMRYAGDKVTLSRDPTMIVPKEQMRKLGIMFDEDWIFEIMFKSAWNQLHDETFLPE